MTNVLEVRELEVRFPSRAGDVVAVDRVSFEVAEGEILGIVGESGSGKSTVLSSCIQLVTPPGQITAGSIRWHGIELLELSQKAMRRLRGREIGMILQDPLTSLHPSLTIGKQIVNAIRDHSGQRTGSFLEIAVQALADAGIPHPRERLGAYPHQLSGGLCQRVMIAMALVNGPRLLLADEPTTALDVTVQAEIIDLLARLNSERRLSVILVTHNFGIVAGFCHRALVMQDGRLVDGSSTGQLFRQPKHPYTRRLLAAVPRVDVPSPRELEPQNASRKTIIRCEGVTKHFRTARRFGEDVVVHALDNVSLEVRAGETLGLVGESGAGKTTLARSLVKLIEPTSGEIVFDGNSIAALSRDELRSFRRRVQFVFQNPYSSLNPRMTVLEHVAEPLQIHQLCAKQEMQTRVAEQLDRVGLPRRLMDRYPRQLSGGERQRVGIARALAVEPEVVIADEPVSALDVSIQAQIIELFAQLQCELDLTLIIVAHDLGLVRSVCDRMAVMYLGQVVEVGSVRDIFTQPRHPYTAALINSAPIPDPDARVRRPLIGGELPSALRPPSGCRFHTRCFKAADRCAVDMPLLEDGTARGWSTTQLAACLYPLNDEEGARIA